MQKIQGEYLSKTNTTPVVLKSDIHCSWGSVQSQVEVMSDGLEATGGVDRCFPGAEEYLEVIYGAGERWEAVLGNNRLRGEQRHA